MEPSQKLQPINKLLHLLLYLKLYGFVMISEHKPGYALIA